MGSVLRRAFVFVIGFVLAAGLVWSLSGCPSLTSAKLTSAKKVVTPPVTHFINLDSIYNDKDIAQVIFEAKDGETIYIECSSYGGGAYDAIGIYDLLVEAQPRLHIVTHASGPCMSGGLIVFCAGEVRTATTNVTFLAHSCQLGIPWDMIKRYYPNTDMDELKRSIQHLDSVLFKILAASSIHSAEWWEAKLRHAWDKPGWVNERGIQYWDKGQYDFYFGLEEASSMGFIKYNLPKHTIAELILFDLILPDREMGEEK